MPIFGHMNIFQTKKTKLMNPRHIHIMLALLLALLGACAEDRGYHQDIQGDWAAYRWTVAQSEEREASQVSFRFEGDRYQAAMGTQEEQGAFRVKGDKLYTQAEGQKEIMVKIARLSNDTLELEMNRGGTAEHLYLRRNQ
jgi:outer membrane biogenesis lipoprotein LolB